MPKPWYRDIPPPHFPDEMVHFGSWAVPSSTVPVFHRFGKSLFWFHMFKNLCSTALLARFYIARWWWDEFCFLQCSLNNSALSLLRMEACDIFIPVLWRRSVMSLTLSSEFFFTALRILQSSSLATCTVFMSESTGGFFHDFPRSCTWHTQFSVISFQINSYVLSVYR